jgi:hypothetical protein
MLHWFLLDVKNFECFLGFMGSIIQKKLKSN